MADIEQIKANIRLANENLNFEILRQAGELVDRYEALQAKLQAVLDYMDHRDPSHALPDYADIKRIILGESNG